MGGLGSFVGKGQSGGLFGMLDQAKKVARAYYTAELPPDGSGAPRHVTRLDIVLKTDPFDAASASTLKLVQTWLYEELPRSALIDGLTAEVYGVTANACDLAEITEADRVRVNVLILAGIFLILVVLVRRPWLALYLLGTVLFSYYATLGATLLAGTLWSGRPLEQVDWRVPFFLFTILVAVGEDYNIRSRR
jgi:RND superfamily putative drug exporter